MRLILAKTLPTLENFRSLPLFFLAGPVRGGGDWQFKMSELLAREFDDCIIANPCRYDYNHPLYKYRVNGPDGFPRQTDWERHFLQLAADRWETGCIIFWLPPEDALNPRKDGGPYARETMGEIGEWRGQMMWARHLRVIVGMAVEFPGASQIERNFELALGREFKIYRTMEEVVARAVFFAQPSLSFRSRVSA